MNYHVTRSTIAVAALLCCCGDFHAQTTTNRHVCIFSSSHAVLTWHGTHSPRGQRHKGRGTHATCDYYPAFGCSRGLWVASGCWPLAAAVLDAHSYIVSSQGCTRVSALSTVGGGACCVAIAACRVVPCRDAGVGLLVCSPWQAFCDGGGGGCAVFHGEVQAELAYVWRDCRWRVDCVRSEQDRCAAVLELARKVPAVRTDARLMAQSCTSRTRSCPSTSPPWRTFRSLPGALVMHSAGCSVAAWRDSVGLCLTGSEPLHSVAPCSRLDTAW